MKTVHGIDLGRVEAAVRAAETTTSGEIRVAIARFYFWGDVRRAAAGAFRRLRIDRTRRRNGVLIFVAPWRHRFAVLGDIGIEERARPALWAETAEIIGDGLRRGDPTGALERGIAALAHELARCFPPEPQDTNELPDTISLPEQRREG